jgi:hypothetical protein
MLRSARCCDSAPPITVDTGWTQPQPREARAIAPLLYATPILFTLIEPDSLRGFARRAARGDPNGLGPPPALHRILRI